MKCPLCRGATHRVFEKHGHAIRDCDACRHRFAECHGGEGHVQQVYDDRYFLEGGAGYADYASDAELQRRRGRWYAGVLGRFMKPGRVIDVGAAGGALLQGLVDRGWQGAGIEPNQRMAEQARERWGLNVEVRSVEGFRTAERYDVVSMIQVVAHFVDPLRSLAAAAELTRPDGFWLIETWNLRSWTARALGRHWHEYSPPSVLHWFTPESLETLAAGFGFEEVARGRPSKWISAGHARSLLRYKLGTSPVGRLAAATARLVPDGLSVPYLADDLFWALFRRSAANATGDPLINSGIKMK